MVSRHKTAGLAARVVKQRKELRCIKFYANDIGGWCNGSTGGSGPLSLGSNQGPPGL